MQSAQSEAAKAGFSAERVLAKQENVKDKLEKKFRKEIKSIDVISGKKSDVVIHFTNGSSAKAQVKNFTEANQAKWPFHQTNRRWLKDLPPIFQGIASHVCLAQPKNRGRLKGLTRQPFLSPYVTPMKEDSKALARLVLLGDEPEWAPDYMILTVMQSGVITGLWIESMTAFFESVDKSMYDEPQLGKEGTSLFLCPEISMQRKGGDGGKPTADQIQFKLYFDKDTMTRHSYAKLI